ncbi:SGNH/GDSL hydrolase family protein [Panacibacter ginsenosidivorans]|uniref:SGNH/GDSL hydrolase family protein n=1 Tax=Panacibacter ginsenosidivorans TaxID=1813871 RepID=A0A5B8VDH3_9BACT|nr:SGNH/GDSL hydrolase family protein [Panacibacter ginsenosidivorans]QEC68328.1 SGNH/GDSL hydrolase family protein [Panacibacter ginsenosidivorans]
MKRLLCIVAIVAITTSFTKKEITWTAIGDSITYLNNHVDETGNRITKGYMTLVTERLPYIHYINQGHNGWTSGGIANEIEHLGLSKSDVYSVFLGTNDWWSGRTLGILADYQNNTGNNTVYGSFRIIINKLRSLNNNAKIILITPMQRVDFIYINDMKNNAWGSYKQKNGQMLSQFADAIIGIAKYEHFDVVDLYHKSGMDYPNLVNFKRLKDPKTGTYKNYPYPDFIDIPFNANTDDYPYPLDAVNITYDGLHPSDKGYAIIAAMLVKIMKRY